MPPCQNFSIHKCSELYSVLPDIKNRINYVKNRDKSIIANIPAAFDIETSSFYDDKEQKTAVMYEWTFGIINHIFIGRTWKEYIWFINTLSYYLGLNDNKRLIVYVHNLNYEFQFIRKWHKWVRVFSIKERTPIYAINDKGIEFRCSYLLSGYSLKKLAENIPGNDIKKLVGNLDYALVHTHKTPLTEEEVEYCVNDVKILLIYINEKIKEEGGNITRIPITKTGYVRRFCREMCFFEEGKTHRKSLKKLRYCEFMKTLILEPEEYSQLKRAFQGGFTHANPLYSGKILSKVTSFDFTSSYPAVMVAEKFPMSKGEKINKVFRDNTEELEKMFSGYCCVMDVEFIGLRSRYYFESYISESRCFKKEKYVANNGRIVSADCVRTTITEQDFIIIKYLYKWEHITIVNLRRYLKAYLPTDFVKAILELYKKKTTLKGVEGKEVEYLQGKEMLNSCYGMAVTDICRDEVTYHCDEWGKDICDVDSELKKYNKNTGRFLFYPWGVWVTAYARRNLFTGIFEFKSDYVYSDTDSIKVLNAENHIDYIEKYNRFITDKLYRACEYHKIDINSIAPQTIKGVKKPLGVWDFDGKYQYFKTLGAKRYMVKYADDKRNGGEKGKISLTVAGLNKKSAIPYMLEKYGENGIFGAFSNHLKIPGEYSGKLTHTYIDEIRQGCVTDYLGVKCEYYELSGIHLEPAEYSLQIASEYMTYLQSLEKEG